MDTLIQLLCLIGGVIAGSLTSIFIVAWIIHRDTMRQVDEISQRWPPILEAFEVIPDRLSDEWEPYVLSDPPPVKVEGGWYKEKFVVFPPPKQKDSDS